MTESCRNKLFKKVSSELHEIFFFNSDLLNSRLTKAFEQEQIFIKQPLTKWSLNCHLLDSQNPVPLVVMN